MRRVYKLLPLSAIVVIAAFGVYNYCNNDKFLEASLFNVLTLFIAVGLAFSLNNRLQDERKHKDIISSMVADIQAFIISSAAYSEDSGRITVPPFLELRRIRNKISLLVKSARLLKIEEELEHLKKAFEEYAEVVEEYGSSQDKLKEKALEIKKCRNIIDTQCDAMVLRIYSST